MLTSGRLSTSLFARDRLRSPPVHSLRAIVRNLLASGTPNLASEFTNAARCRFYQTNAKSLPSTLRLFTRKSSGGAATPTPQLNEVLTRARSLYGAGMGFASLGILASVVRATLGIRWEEDGEMTNALAVIDTDIGQAIQVSVNVPAALTHLT
jgi:hypothetical protein